jgi:hypothetical protein
MAFKDARVKYADKVKVPIELMTELRNVKVGEDFGM